ncbi:acyltransferase family protein [Micromonospora sp. 067-2]|uniref:acyltransferase family protein n=1 Tax=Micromonospora sp. 067-2 TaxID=2789270 RepID=UPI00397E1CFC
MEGAPHRPAPPLAATPGETAGPSRRPRGDRLYILDLLRFCAAAAVLCYHVFVDNRGAWGTSAGELFGEGIVSVSRYGWMGVEFFFVISGFVICMSCWGKSVADFFTSRVTRLVPAYLFAVLFTSAVLMVWPLASGRPQPSHVLMNLTMLQSFVGIPHIDSVYWTLFIELKFYLLFAVVVWFGLTYRRVVLFCVFWTVAALFAQGSDSPLLVSIVEPKFAPYFIAGIALYLCHRFGPNLLLTGIVGVSVVLAILEVSRRVAEQNANRPKPVVSFEVALPVMLAFFAVMAAIALGFFSGVRWRGLTILGSLTYPLYLLHLQISRVALSRLHESVPPWALLAALLAGVMLLAYLAHRFVERPGARFLRRQLQRSFTEIRAQSSSSSKATGERRTAESDQHGGSVRSDAGSPMA